jgi:hypothetical protein
MPTQAEAAVKFIDNFDKDGALGKKHQRHMKYVLHQYGYSEPEGVIPLKLNCTSFGDGFLFTGVAGPLRGIFRVEIVPYPHCCAMWQANGFQYYGMNSGVDPFVADVMDHIMFLIQKHYYGFMKRLVFNFVEGAREVTTDDGDVDYKYRFGDIPPLEETDMANMRYPAFYKWAISKNHQELLTVNHNTNRIIHFTDVMLGSLL